jgi:homocysteine S-methyltransferase
MNSAELKNLFFERRSNKPLILDGAMGSYLQQKGYVVDDIIWTTRINISNPDAIINIHKEYIDAGADIITTNTFRTNPAALKKSGVGNTNSYVRQAVSLAIQASEGSNILIAGSNAPAEDCYRSHRSLSNYELELNHKNHIDLLIDSGVHLVWNETQSHLDEIMIICTHCSENNVPYVLSLYVDNELKLLSGETIKEVFSLLQEYNPLAIGLNCITPDLFLRIIGSIDLPMSWGFYLNCGSGQPSDKEIHCGLLPDEYQKCVKSALIYSPSYVGSCCGSNPSHTKKIRELIYG